MVATYDGWPAKVRPPPRPSQVMPFGASDTTLVARTARAAW
jgi:hypothetical protein